MKTSTALGQRPPINSALGGAGWTTACVLSISSTLLLTLSTAARSATLTNGAIEIEIREDNGAIDRIFFGGSDFYNPGFAASDFGFQMGTDTKTFVRNTTTGVAEQPVSVASFGDAVAVSGIYTAGGANIKFTRTYSLVPGLNVLRTTTELANR
ncbi:MAG: hypothetical protein SVX43_20140, partial [Cyanobacteriota bacterium]|nr:hypothetical protein [Cyanobacteriota bacterium]